MAFKLAITDRSGIEHAQSYWYPAIIHLDYAQPELVITYRGYAAAEKTNFDKINLPDRVYRLTGVKALQVLGQFFAGADVLDLLDNLALSTKDVSRTAQSTDEEGNPVTVIKWTSFFEKAERVKPILNLPEGLAGSDSP